MSTPLINVVIADRNLKLNSEIGRPGPESYIENRLEGEGKNTRYKYATRVQDLFEQDTIHLCMICIRL